MSISLTHDEKQPGISISKNKDNITVCLWKDNEPNRQIELDFDTNTRELINWFINDEEI